MDGKEQKRFSPSSCPWPEKGQSDGSAPAERNEPEYLSKHIKTGRFKITKPGGSDRHEQSKT